ncbi:SET domain-containing protein [Lentinus brumalis]|uniref:SET domain-containing protein n=1 Tax=Lentinus brumalis TaxID=2498619 RepID=A0A371CYM3_9APHY|nr:SET domain-containing protein [Polyporus brumalis]
MCKLASLCRVDCRDVYHHRLLLLPRKHSTIPRDEEEDYPAGPAGIERELDPYLCRHDGPCTPEICVCARDDRRCCRRCSCFARCARRKGPATSQEDARDWRKGCVCKDGICEHGCPCEESGWECSPELCIPFENKRTQGGGGGSTQKHLCQHMDIQREVQPEIIVKEGSYGMGAFVDPKKTIPKTTYLGEYVAEMFPLLRGPEGKRANKAERKIYRHRKLNYMFTDVRNDVGEEIAPITLFDAATVGNPTRFFNDSLLDKTKVNVYVGTSTVDGDRRLGMWTSKYVKKGQELLLDYGSGYWVDDGPSSDEEEFDTESVTLADEQDKDKDGSGESRTACDDDEKDNA